MSDDNTGNLNLKKDLYLLRIKTILVGIQKINFEEFLKNHLNLDIELSPHDVFQHVIIESLMAVEYAIKKNDAEILRHANTLIENLESEQGDEENIPLARIFAKLLTKAKNVCEAGLSVSGMIVTFEWEYFKRSFNEKIPQKIAASDKHDSTIRYSNN